MNSKFYLALSIAVISSMSSTQAATKAKKNKSSATTLATQTLTAEPSHRTTRIQWLKFPQLDYSDRELKQHDRNAIVRITANEEGRVTDASIQESTGIAALDRKLIQTVLQARTQPVKYQDNALSTVGYQSFNFILSQNQPKQCQYDFASKHWAAQQNDKHPSYRYRSQPQLNVSSEDLNHDDRTVKFSFKADKHGHAKKAKITQGSGSYKLDNLVLAAVETADVDVSRKYWIYKKAHFKDQISFKLDQCDTSL